DPNFGRRVRNRRQLNSLQNTWPYGYSMPIAVRYTQDAFSRSGWLWPVDAKGEPLKATSYMARSEERFSRNAETDLVCRLLLEKKKAQQPMKAECDSRIRLKQSSLALSVQILCSH